MIERRFSWANCVITQREDAVFKRRVFVSYCADNQDQAGFLASRLGAEGFEVFFAPRAIEKGQNFENEIEKALANCDAFIVLISEASNKSEWVQREISVAAHRHNNGRLRFLIPIIIEADAKPPKILQKIQCHRMRAGELQDWDRVATQISVQIQRRGYILLLAFLLLLTGVVWILEAKIGEQFYYLPFVLILELLTILFVWFNWQTRSKRLSLIMFLPLVLQFLIVGSTMSILRRNESEQAKTNAFALCNAANDVSFDFLWDRFGSSRSHRKFVDGLIEVLENEAMTSNSRINARVALARIGEFQYLTAKLDPVDNTTLFEFVRKPDRWLKEEAQLNWVLTWLQNSDSRLVVWGIRTLGLAHEVLQKFPPSNMHRVRQLLLRSIETTNHAGILNNSRWTLSKLGTDQIEIGEAEKKRRALNSPSQNTLDHLSAIEIKYGITLVLINLPGQSFYLSDAEVTVEQFSRFVEDTPQFKTSAENLSGSSCFGHDGAWYGCTASWRNVGLPEKMPPTRNLPAVHLSWVDAVQFCNWMSKQEGLTVAYESGPNGTWHLIPGRNGYRLPSMTEWQTASRAGTVTPFWWADFGEWRGDKDWHCDVANLPDSSFSNRWKRINAIEGTDDYPFHAPVKTFAPNGWGMFEMVGNVAEWCDEDDQVGMCQEYALGKKPRLGGSWGDDIQFVTTTGCRAEGPATSHVNVGFRISRSVR